MFWGPNYQNQNQIIYFNIVHKFYNGAISFKQNEDTLYRLTVKEAQGGLVLEKNNPFNLHEENSYES